MAYNKYGRYLDLIKWTITSTGPLLPILPYTALHAEKKTCLHIIKLSLELPGSNKINTQICNTFDPCHMSVKTDNVWTLAVTEGNSKITSSAYTMMPYRVRTVVQASISSHGWLLCMGRWLATNSSLLNCFFNWTCGKLSHIFPSATFNSNLFWASDDGFKIASCVAPQTWYIDDTHILKVIRWHYFQSFVDSYR